MNVTRLNVQRRDPVEARVAAAVAALAAVADDNRQPEVLRREAHRARLRLVEQDGARGALLLVQHAQADADGL